MRPGRPLPYGLQCRPLFWPGARVFFVYFVFRMVYLYFQPQSEELLLHFLLWLSCQLYLVCYTGQKRKRELPQISVQGWTASYEIIHFQIYKIPFTNLKFTIYQFIICQFTIYQFIIYQFTIYPIPIYHLPIYNLPFTNLSFTNLQFTIHQFTFPTLQFTI